MYRRILVPCDGSEPSKRGLAEAVRLARDQGAALRCLHVIDEHVLAHNYLGVVIPPDLFDLLRDNGRKVLEEARAQAAGGGVAPETVLRESGGRRVSATILDEARAWPADLIVMGTHGRRGLSHLALGSDAELVVRESPVPVLLVRASP